MNHTDSNRWAIRFLIIGALILLIPLIGFPTIGMHSLAAKMSWALILCCLIINLMSLRNLLKQK